MASNDKGGGGGTMGDLFSQRRAAAAAATTKQQQKTTTQPSPSRNNKGNPSFLEIQEEQQREESNRRTVQNRGSGGYSSRGGYNSRGGYDDGRYSGGGRRDGYGGSGGYDRRDNYNSRDSRRSSRGPNLNSLPLEQGKIVTLLDKYGFIHCANRPSELFFHYSEFKGRHSDDLNIHDEVEFRVGPASSFRSGGGGGGGRGGEEEEEKMAAYSVVLLEKGTVQWEVEEEPRGVRRRGKVERVAGRGDGRDRGRGGGDGLEGVICILEEEEESGEKETIYYANDDYESSPSSPASRSSKYSRADSLSSNTSTSARLGRNDLVEFTLVTELRTNRKYARGITLIQSERDRLREEREKKLLEHATLERGVIEGLKEDFGFLRSSCRRELVFFHFSHVVPPSEGEKGEEGGGGGGRWGDLNLKEGQDVEFLVVKEEERGGGGGRGSQQQPKEKLSARKVKFLPKGSVEFFKVVKHGVAGTVLEPPHPAVEPLGSSSGGRSGKSSAGGNGATPAVVGKVRLHEAISYKPDNDNEKSEVVITEVLFHPKDSPGGSFVITRDGSQLGVWVREGDTLLFDVVQDLVDNTFCVSPTLCRHKEEEPSPTIKPHVRLTALAIAGRAEGIVSAVRDNYGFIHCAERNVDAYFRLYELLPTDLQKDLRDDETISPPKDFKNLVGLEVSFDLSLQGIVAAPPPPRGSGRNKHSTQEKENLKAQRILILPPNSVQITKVLASSIKGVVSKEDPKQPYAGYIDLETPIRAMTQEERHPMIAQLLDQVSNGDQDEIIFHDVQSEKEHQVVQGMVNGRADLDWSFVPAIGLVEVDSSHPGRLRIFKLKPNKSNGGGGDGTAAVETTSTSDGATDVSSDVNGGKEGEESTEETKPAAAVTTTTTPSKKKKKPKKPKAMNTIRYDKHSLYMIKGSGGPPAKGDVVTCDIIQSRRTGAITVENLHVVERKQIERGMVVPGSEVESSEASSMGGGDAGKINGVGLVIEVVPRSQYGFINVFDETATKQEKLFFHMSNVFSSTSVSSSSSSSLKEAEQSGNGNGERSILSSKHGNNINAIRKGDEVKFEFGTGKGGKRIALNVQILPHGTLNIPARTDKNACQGYVLMEPSHTSLANTPSHVVHTTHSKGNGGGRRWDNVGKEDKIKNTDSGSNVKEEGCILLLSDPANLFAQKQIEKKSTETKSAESSETEQSTNEGDAKEGNSDAAEGSSDSKENIKEEHNSATETKNINSSEKNDSKHGVTSTVKIISAVGTHLHYKNGAVALRGGVSYSDSSSSAPKRGDLVSFVKGKSGKNAKDLRVVKKGAAKTVRGQLQNIDKKNGTAEFVCSDDTKAVYGIGLSEVVSCHLSTLKEKLAVEGILHEGKIYGVCRTVDLYLESKISVSSGKRERPRLNLTVKKELQGMGGKIIAQSGMAKGPDGTNGFAKGWTKRLSPYAATFTYHPEETNSTSSEAPPEEATEQNQTESGNTS